MRGQIEPTLETNLSKVIRKQMDVSIIFNDGLNKIANDFHHVPGLLEEIKRIGNLAKNRLQED